LPPPDLAGHVHTTDSPRRTVRRSREDEAREDTYDANPGGGNMGILTPGLAGPSTAASMPRAGILERRASAAVPDQAPRAPVARLQCGVQSSLARRSVAVIVAHPDDETLWCGGFILEHPAWSWYVVALSRARDPDRAPRFRRVLARLGAAGVLGDLDDGPEQQPLLPSDVEDEVASLLPRRAFDLVLTHGPGGEYTRHRRHEECCRAVVALWQAGRLETHELWLFAYQDDGRAHPPRVSGRADCRRTLPEAVWRAKLEIVTGLYGFGPESWEARATPREEGFCCFSSPAGAADRISSDGVPS